MEQNRLCTGRMVFCQQLVHCLHHVLYNQLCFQASRILERGFNYPGEQFLPIKPSPKELQEDPSCPHVTTNLSNSPSNQCSSIMLP